MWIKVSAEEARQHPLFGVKGSLIVVGCLMILLVLLDPPIQIISKQVAGLRPTFVPGAYFIVLIVATWGLFRRKAYVRAYVYGLAVLTIVGLIFLFYLGGIPYLPYGAEDALVNLLIQDIPLCSYFTWSRRARVTLECRVRSDDPLLSKRDVAGIQTAAQSAGKAEPLAIPAADANTSELRPGRHVNAQDASPPPSDQPASELESQRKFELLLQYSSFIRDAYEAISDLPEELKQRFRAAVLEPGGHHEAKAVGARLLDEHRKRIRPFDSAEANDLLAKARELGSAAEKEFMDVMELLGSSASPTAIFDKINNKYGIKEVLKDEQGMLAFLKEKNFMVRVSKGRFFSPEYRITEPLTGNTTFHDGDTLQAFCRRVWEQRLSPNSRT